MPNDEISEKRDPKKKKKALKKKRVKRESH